MTYSTARRSDIIRGLQSVRQNLGSVGRTDEVHYADLITDAISILEGKGLPFDELAVAPMPAEIRTATARATDPPTSRGYTSNLTSGNARSRLAVVFRDASGPLTPEEAVELAGPCGRSPWKRVSELEAGLLIEATGQTKEGPCGLPQKLLRITPLGRAKVAEMLKRGDS